MRRVTALTLFLLALLYQGLTVYTAFIRKDILMTVFLHWASCAAFFTALYWKVKAELRRNYSNPIYIYSVIICLFFPLIGPFFSIIFLLLVFGSSKEKEGIFDEYGDYIRSYNKKESSLSDSYQYMAKIREEVGFEPLTDIMHGRESDLKTKAIDKLAKRITADNVMLLKEATKDPSREVRLYASSALLKMESSLSDQIERAYKTAERTQTTESFADLADLYFRYAQSGFLENVLVDYYLNLAKDAYAKCTESGRQNLHIARNHVRCLIKLKEYNAAVLIADKWVRGEGADADMTFLYNEALYYSGRFESIASNFARSKQSKSLKQSEAGAFWLKD